jgi:hypothetical protein
MVRARSSPGEWIAAASASTPMWGTAVRWLTQTGGHRRGKRGGCALDWSGGGTEGGKGGDDGAQSLLKRHGGGAEDGGGVWPEAAPRDEEVEEGPGPTGGWQWPDHDACVGDTWTGEDGVLTHGPGHCAKF